MKVICIDNSPGTVPSPFKSHAHLLEEGKTYTVIRITPWGYILAELPHPHSPYGHWSERRFVPCSSIDERELVKKREETCS